MKKLTVILFGALLTSPVLAEKVDQTQDVEADGRIDVYNMSGSIEIIGWDRNQVNVSGEIGDDVEELFFEVNGSHTEIKVKIPNRSRGHKDVSADIVVRVPAASSIDVGSVSSDIDIEDVTGEQDVQSVSGDITTAVFAADVDIETVSGDVNADGNNTDAETKLESVSGDVTADGLSGDLRIGTVSGDLDVTDGDFDRTKAETVNGDISFVAALRSGGKMDFETVNGTVDVGFVGDVGAKFEIETFNGRIRNCFGPEPERTSRYTPGWELSFTEGDGDGRVSIATLNGGVKLCKD